MPSMPPVVHDDSSDDEAAAAPAAAAPAAAASAAPLLTAKGQYPFTYLHFRIKNGPNFTDETNVECDIAGFGADLFAKYWHALMDEMWTEAARAGAVLRGNRLEWTHALRSVAACDRLARLRQPLLTSKLVPDGTITEAEHPWRGGPKQSQYEKTLVGQNDDKAQIDYDQYAITGDNSYRLRESAGYRQKLLDTKLKDPQTPDLKAKREAVLAEIRAIEAYVQPGKDGMPKKDSLEKAHASVRPMGSAAFPPWILVPSQLRSPIYRWKMKTVGGRLVPGDLPEAEVNGPATYHDLEPPTMTRPTTWNGGSTDYPRTRALWRVTCLLWDLGVRMTALQSTRHEDYKDAFGDEHAEYRGYFTSWPGARSRPPRAAAG